MSSQLIYSWQENIEYPIGMQEFVRENREYVNDYLYRGCCIPGKSLVEGSILTRYTKLWSFTTIQEVALDFMDRVTEVCSTYETPVILCMGGVYALDVNGYLGEDNDFKDENEHIYWGSLKITSMEIVENAYTFVYVEPTDEVAGYGVY